MGKYKIVFRKSVAKDLRAIPKQDVRRILAAFDSLSQEPRPMGVEKLSGQEKYRLRRGDYRTLFEIRDDEKVVVVTKVSHRREAYRRGQS